MPFDGSGTFNRLYNWQQDDANDIGIMADRMDNEMNGMATALSNCLTRDSQAPMLAALDAGNFKITRVADPTSDQDAETKKHVADNYVLKTGGDVIKIKSSTAEIRFRETDAPGNLTYRLGALGAGGFYFQQADDEAYTINVENIWRAIPGSVDFYRSMNFYDDAATPVLNVQFLNTGRVTMPNLETTASSANCFISPSGIILKSTSALKYKERVESLSLSIDSSEVVDGLEPVTYYPKDLPADRQNEYIRTVGIIADDAENYIPLLCTYKNGEIDGFQYDRLAVVLLEEIKRLRVRVALLEDAQ